MNQVVSVNPTPRQFAESLVACLAPLMDELYEVFMAQLAADLYVFQIPGDESGAAGFMETWIRTLRE
ncbi:hypothetical protein ABT124_32120 [Streptomyces sp. NPDC001982]|uniref:hypothetical protein n=1 Tax=Streptomyces sp. NPDC001982 TaxID=3154405 RepID=UPI00331A48E3